ncbi:hypothetical protein [Halobacillus sp. Marseille-Q1614]|nr:hypothetical protein [Halobacillus sp. Marseille-Q1614]
MVYFLLVISFILHGVLILTTIALFTRLKQSEELERSHHQAMKDMAELFA